MNMKKILAAIMVLVLFSLTMPLAFAESGSDMPFRGLWYDDNGIKVYCTNYGLRYYALHSSTKEPLIQTLTSQMAGQQRTMGISLTVVWILERSAKVL